MTPDQIKPGRTYETSDGQSWTVDEIFSKVASRSEGNGSMISTLDQFAGYAVRDVTPTPESDQGEKVAEAQSQGASRGDGRLLPCPHCGSSDIYRRELVNAVRQVVAVHFACGACEMMGPKEGDREGESWNRRTPPAAAINAELLAALKGLVGLVRAIEPGVSNRIDSARAAIARAEGKQ